MTELKQIYKCNICGNIVEMLHAGAGELVCCGQPMELKKENAVDAAQEKHVPVIEKTPVPSSGAGATGQAFDGVTIKVGSDAHPMDDDHYIEWIEISTDKGSSKKFIGPGDKPEVSFPVKADDVSARAYCNLHGLWKSE